MHISIPKDVKELQLKPFSKNRKQSMSATIRYAIEKLFEQEDIDPKRHAALRTVINRNFVIPSYHTLTSFWGQLIVEATKRPNGSSRKEWGDVAYRSTIDKTNREIFIQLKEQLALETNEELGAKNVQAKK